MSANIQHSAEHVEHYTPSLIVEPSRHVLGGFDLDPASCTEANATVHADAIFTEADGGLFQDWWGRVFLNPPGGKLHKSTLEPIKKGPGLSAAAVWWAKLWNEWRIGRVDSAIFVAFSLNLFQNAQRFDADGVPPPQSFPFVVPRKRIEFYGPGKRTGASHPNAVVLLSRKPDELARFCEGFAPLGRVIVPTML
jgi:hypothetical protein